MLLSQGLVLSLKVVSENTGLKLIYFFWEEGPWLPRVEEIMIFFSQSSLQMQ